MARRLRVEFPGAVYHVMARGNERREIFRDDEDRRRFLNALAEAVERFGLRLHAYCLMPNHYHLLLATPRANLSRAMGWMQTTYTARFNARHRRRGHLFQGRYKAQVVEADEYARWLVEYVHLNPVRPSQKAHSLAPERAEELTHYPWSSHRDYGGWQRKSPPWLCLDWLHYWGRTRREAQEQYRKAIRRAFGREARNPWQQLRGGLVLGGDGLYRKVRQLTGQEDGLEQARWTQGEAAAETREKVRRLVESESDDRVKMWARVRLGAERGVAVAHEYGYTDSSGLTQVVKRLEARAVTDKRLARKLKQLAKLSKVND
jgi:REP element-mobilizing transposase RayT